MPRGKQMETHMNLSCVITGANRGLGLKFARQLSARGDQVTATARKCEQAVLLKALSVRLETLDVADGDSIAAFAGRMKGVPIDVLINNAGIGNAGEDLAQLDFDELARYFRVNSIGPLRVTQALFDNLLSGKHRRVVHITSEMGSIAENTSGGYYGYRAGKTALNSFNRTLALELAPQRFTCVVIHPGWVKTDMGGNEAPLAVEESVAGMLRVIDRLTPDQNGRFLDFQGQEIAW